MRETRSCQHCGAGLTADARFCETCGKPVPPSAQPVPPLVGASAPVGSAALPVAPLAAPPAAAPRPVNSRLFLGLGIVGVIVVLGCIAIAAFGFLFMQNQSATPRQLPVSSPQIAAVPTRVSQTNVPPPTESPLPTVRSTSPTPPATTAPTTVPKPIPTITTVPSAVPVSPAGVLLQEDFSSKEIFQRNGWPLQSSGFVEYAWSPNAYKISVNTDHWFAQAMPNQEFQDFAIETEALPVGNDPTESGLVFRYSKTGNNPTFYLFTISTDGLYRLSKQIDGKYADPMPVPRTNSPQIKPGPLKNTLGVITQGNRIMLYINRVLVTTVTDDSIKGKGQVGVDVGTREGAHATVIFSRFTVLTPEQAKAQW